MLQKLKITTCAFILCLFGLTLMTVTPVFAEDSQEFKSCQQMKWKGNKKAKKNCFRDLAQATQPSDGSRSPEVVACQDMKWKKGKKAKKNCFRDLARAFMPLTLVAPQLDPYPFRTFCHKTLDEMDVRTFREACPPATVDTRGIVDPEYGRACGLSSKMIHPAYLDDDIRDIETCMESSTTRGHGYANPACKISLQNLRKHASEIMQPGATTTPSCTRECGCGGKIDAYRATKEGIEGWTFYMHLSCADGTLVHVNSVANVNKSWTAARDACGF